MADRDPLPLVLLRFGLDALGIGLWFAALAWWFLDWVGSP